MAERKAASIARLIRNLPGNAAASCSLQDVGLDDTVRTASELAVIAETASRVVNTAVKLDGNDIRASSALVPWAALHPLRLLALCTEPIDLMHLEYSHCIVSNPIIV